MRILVSCNEYLPALSGVPIAVSNLTRCFAEIGHQVRILSSLHDSTLPRVDTIQNIPVYRFQWSPKPLVTLPWRFSKTLWQIQKLCLSWQPDVVYVHFLSTNALYPLILSYLLHFPFVISARGYDIEGLPYEKPFHLHDFSSVSLAKLTKKVDLAILSLTTTSFGDKTFCPYGATPTGRVGSSSWLRIQIRRGIGLLETIIGRGSITILYARKPT